MKVKELISHMHQFDPEQFVLLQDREGWCYDIADVKVEHVSQGEVIFPEEQPEYDNALVAVVLVPN